MGPMHVVHYLTDHGVRFVRHTHPPVLGAHRLAEVLQISGDRIGKTVLIEADGTPWIALLPASETVDDLRLAETLRARHVTLATPTVLDAVFPDCERGVEPPFGRLFGLPVVVDLPLARMERVLVRAGAPEESVELEFADYAALERPLFGEFGRRHGAEALPTPW